MKQRIWFLFLVTPLALGLYLILPGQDRDRPSDFESKFWLSDLQKAKERARETGKPMLVQFR